MVCYTDVELIYNTSPLEAVRLNPRMTSLKAQDNDFHVLALDGGGTRGIYPAQILACIEQKDGVPIKERFNLIAGTSTGSIIAGAAAAGVPMTDMVKLFKKQSRRIFHKRRLNLNSLLHVQSKYLTQPLQEVIGRCVGGLTLGQISTPLMIMGSDVSSGTVRVFKSRYLEDLDEPYVNDARVELSDAILASCAAPTYFDPVRVGDVLLADGGLWANNPSVIALTEAVSKFQRSIEQVWILSIGTGHPVTVYSRKNRWGLLTGWERRKLVSYVLRLQSDASANIAKLLLGDRYLRLDPEIGDWELDDIDHLDNLRAMATREFACRSKEIMKNLKTSDRRDTSAVNS